MIVTGAGTILIEFIVRFSERAMIRAVFPLAAEPFVVRARMVFGLILVGFFVLLPMGPGVSVDFIVLVNKRRDVVVSAGPVWSLILVGFLLYGRVGVSVDSIVLARERRGLDVGAGMVLSLLLVAYLRYRSTGAGVSFMVLVRQRRGDRHSQCQNTGRINEFAHVMSFYCETWSTGEHEFESWQRLQM